MNAGDAFADQRRRIVRRIGFLTWGLAAAAVAVGVGGGALVAWVLVGAGFPFLRTWLVATLLLLMVPAAVNIAQRRSRAKREPEHLDQ